jgi:TRAP-type C4-dicarboxylate transport system permease small subunit
MNAMNRLLGFVKLVELAASTVAGAGLIVIMFVVCMDVAGRYVFNSPLGWSYDLISMYLLALSFFFALSDTLRRGYHINVDIIFNRFHPRTQFFWNMLGWAMSSVLFCLITALLVQRAYIDWVEKNVIVADVDWQVWIGAAIAGVGALLITIRLVMGTFLYGMAFIKNDAAWCAVVTETPHAPGGEHIA